MKPSPIAVTQSRTKAAVHTGWQAYVAIAIYSVLQDINIPGIDLATIEGALNEVVAGGTAVVLSWLSLIHI